jgi:uncharacterized protein (DUF362 family)
MTRKYNYNGKIRPRRISRRDFLKLIALTSVLAGCRRLATTTPSATSSPTATFAPTATATIAPTATSAPSPIATLTSSPSSPVGMGKFVTSRVAFVKTTDRSAGVRKAIDLLGINPVAGKTVFIKPNFNSSDPAPGSTHPDTLRTLVLKLREMEAQEITMGDRSGMGLTQQVMRELGVFELAEELGVAVIDFDSLVAENWQIFMPPGSHWKQGFPFARPCIQAEALVQVCCLKTHQYGGHFTMSLKNSVGMVAAVVPGGNYSYMEELHTSSHQRAMIAEVNTAYTPALIVLDGIKAFTRGGPATGDQVSPEVVLAGTDRIAIDAVGVALLRYFGTTVDVTYGPIFQQEQIARAVELGLGVDSPHKIELITEDPDSAAYAEQIRKILVSQ